MIISCPNKNSPEYRELILKVGEVEAFKTWYKNNGEISAADVATLPDNIVNSAMKAFNILLTDRAANLFNKFYLKGNKDKFFSELQIPKNQIELLNTLPTVGSVLELTDSLQNTYGFNVEINTTMSSKNLKENFYGWAADGFSGYEDFELNGYKYTQGEELEFDGEMHKFWKRNNTNISKKDFIAAAQEAEKLRKATPTSYYFNVSVPGGTSYIENEISTPQIVPSIKGHAQFATDNGIGWFRSDEQTILGNISEADIKAANAFGLEPEATKRVSTKTRRILEVQSDLFQKGRDKADIVQREEIENINDVWGSGEDKADKITSKKNNFLQLLNKDNNWVTFFIKSIIQDSAKKGYEKVLFPSGDTAARIEGHQTVQGFIDDKQEQLDRLNIKLNSELNQDNLGRPVWLREKEQLEKEIEDAKSGKLKISVIANFYETTITNILKKQGYAPNRITDEHGNTWNEIDIDSLRDLSSIYYQKISARPIEETYRSKEAIVAKLQNQGVIHKFKGEYYVSKGPSRGMNIKGLYTYEDNYQKNLDTVKQMNEDFYQARGTYLFDLIALPNSTKIRVSQEGLAQVNKEFTDNVDTPTRELLRNLFARTGVEYSIDYNLPYAGVFRNGKVVVNPTHSNFGSDTVWHEALGHPIVEAIFQKGSNKALWTGLVGEVNNNQELINKINKDYPELAPNSDEWYKEAITTLLGIKLADGKAKLGSISITEKLMALVKRLFTRVADLLNSYFSNKDKTIKIEDLVDKPLTFNELTTLLLGENNIDLSSTEFRGTYFKKVLSDAQINTINKITELGAQYENLVTSGQFYKTPTKAMGSTFNAPEAEGDQIYKVFQEFGTSLHFILERLVRGDKFSDIIESIPDIENAFASKKQLQDIIYDLGGMVRSLGAVNAHILTESKVVAETRDGIPIIGKTDLIVVRENGSVDILDLKTKKLKDVDNLDIAITRQRNSINKENSPLVEPEFTDPNYKRNTEEAWILQLSTYAAMLKQHGIKINSTKILPFAYVSVETKEDDKIIARNLTNYKVYEGRDYTSRQVKFAKAFVPFVEEEVKVDKKQEDIYGFTDEQKDKVVTGFKTTFDAKIKSLSTQIRESTDEKVTANLTEQREQLRKAKDLLDSLNNNDYKILHTSSYVRSFLNQAVTYADNTKNITDPTEKLDKLKFVAGAAEHISEVLDSIERILLTNNIPNTSQMHTIIKDARNSIQSINVRLDIENEINATNLMLQAWDADKRARMVLASDELKNTIVNKEALIKEIESSTGSLDPRKWKVRLNSLKRDVLELQAKFENIPVTEEQVRAIVELRATTPGASMKFNKFFAAAGTSDPVLHAIVDTLKAAFRRAQKKTLEYLQDSKIQEAIDKYLVGKDRTTASEPISEVSEKLTYDKDGKEVLTKTRSLIRPFIDSYEQDSIRLNRNVKNLQKELKEASFEDKTAIRERYYEALRQRSEWIEANQQLKYIPEYYRLKSIMNADARAWFEDWTTRRQDYITKFRLDEGNMASWTADDLDTFEAFSREYKQAMSLDDGNGNLKQPGTTEYSVYISLQEYNEASQKIYENIYNESAYNVAYSKAIETYKSDLEGMRRWERAYSRVVNTDQFWTDYNNLNEQIERLVGSKPNLTTSVLGEVMTLNEIFARIKEIKKGKTDVNGVIDGSLFTRGQISSLDQLEAARDDIYDALKGSSNLRATLSDAEFSKFLDLTAKKNAMAAVEVTDVYNNTYREKLKDYEANIEALEADELTAEQFEALENKFASWFRLNHNNSFISYFVRKGTKLENSPIIAYPKSIWKQWAPIDKEKYTKRIGNSKFYYKRIKDTAYNKNYQEFIDGTPVPNFININKGVFDITKKSKYLNPRYQTLTQSKDFSFYNKIKDMFFENQTGTSKNYLGFNIPGYFKKDMDSIMQLGLVEGTKTIVNEKINRHLKPGSITDEELGFANSTPTTQLRHNKPLPIEQQSFDSIGCILRWTREANINKEMNAVGPQIESTLNYFRGRQAELSKSLDAIDKQKAKDLSVFLEQASFEYQKYINGFFKEYGLLGNKADKALDTFMGYSSLTKMAFNIPAQLVNIISGNVQNSIMATGEFYDTKDLAKANSLYFSEFIPQLMRDEGKIGNKGLLTQMWESYNPMQKELDPWLDVLYGGTARRFYEAGPSMFLKDKGENQIAATAWLAMMLKQKVTTTDGTLISLYDAHELDSEGKMRIRPDVDFTEKNVNNFSNKVEAIIRRSQGNFAGIDQTQIEKFAWGRALFFFKKWFLPMFRDRFKTSTVENDIEQTVAGFYRTFFHCLTNIGVRETIKSMISKNNSTLTEIQRQHSIKTVRENLIGFGLLSLGYIFANMAEDDDDNWVYSMGAFLTMRTANETMQFNPLPFVGGADQYIQTVNSLSIGLNTGKQMLDGIQNTTALALAGIMPNWDWVQEKAYYQQDTWIFDEGDARVTKQIYQLTGLNNVMNLLYPDNSLKFTFKDK